MIHILVGVQIPHQGLDYRSKERFVNFDTASDREDVLDAE